MSVLNLNAGKLSEGAPADLTLIDLESQWTVKGSQMQSLSSNTCFEGIKMQSEVIGCWSNGKNIFLNSKLKT